MKRHALLKSKLITLLNNGHDPMRMGVKELANEAQVNISTIESNIEMIASMCDHDVN